MDFPRVFLIVFESWECLVEKQSSGISRGRGVLLRLSMRELESICGQIATAFIEKREVLYNNLAISGQ